MHYIIMPNTFRFDSFHVASLPKVSAFIFVHLAKSLKEFYSNKNSNVVYVNFYFQTVGTGTSPCASSTITSSCTSYQDPGK